MPVKFNEMFKVSQEINLCTGDISPAYGRYQRTPDDGKQFKINLLNFNYSNNNFIQLNTSHTRPVF